ncbi:MAG: ArsA family ATPase [Vicinamibacterales bacterium]|nr:ArsA family ATPase [Vicinamibacterales bacterium]
MLLNRRVLEAALAGRVLFVGGKGGVGKTTVAAALAVRAARQGRRCLVVSTDPAHSLGDVFDRAIGGGVTPLGDRLWGLEIEPEAEANRHIASVINEMKRLVHPRMYDVVEKQLDLARDAPGTLEAALLERMAELMAEAGARFDLIVFDTAPTGHTLRLLRLPELMSAWTDGLLRHRERSSQLSSVLDRFGGGPASTGDDLSMFGGPDDERQQHLQGLLEARQQKLRLARDLLLDRTATAFLLVLNADKLSLLESMKALESLERARIPVAAAIVNRLTPEDADGAFAATRRRREAVHREAIARAFSHLPRIDIPLLADDVTGVETLARLGQLLMGEDGEDEKRSV